MSSFSLIPGGRDDLPSGGGGGPRDPLLEARVDALERRFDRFETKVEAIGVSLQRYEVLLETIRANLLNTATRSDVTSVEREASRLREASALLASRADLTDVTKDIAKIREDVAHVKGRLENVPSTWQMMTYMVSSQIAFAGLLFVAIKLGLQ